MTQYGNFNVNKKSKRKKIINFAIVAAAVIMAVIYILGLIAGSDGADKERVSSAVAENVKLKEQVSEMSERIAFLETENEELAAQLALAPTPVPTAEVPQESIAPTSTPTQNTSPRGDI